MQGGTDGAETRWLERARAGDEWAFAQLVEAFERLVFNLCYRMLGDAAEAEDAAQETFLKAYRGLARHDPDRPFRPWLLSIASHHCIDRLRRRRLLLTPMDDLQGEQTPASPAAGPEAVALEREQRGRVQRMLAGLAPMERAAVVLRYWYDLSYEEIGQVLALSESAVKSRLHRARRQLAELWRAGEEPALARGGTRNEPSTAQASAVLVDGRHSQ
jgi:RNA polymerase sigma-70 factor (ECF subfamily)